MIIDTPPSLTDSTPAAAAVRVESGGSHPPRQRAGLGRPVLLMAAALAVAAMGLGAWFLMDEPRLEPRAAPPVEFQTALGERISLPALRGRVVLVSFWGEACPACERQMPAIVQMQQQWLAQGLVTIAVATPELPVRKVLEFASRHALPHAGGVDPTREIAHQLGPIQVLPTHVVIDRQGMIVQRLEGDVPTARLEGRISEALAGG